MMFVQATYQNGPRRGRPWIFDVPKGPNWATGWIQILVPKWGRGPRLDLSGVLAPAIEPCRTVVEQDQTATLVVNSHVFIEYRSSRMQSASLNLLAITHIPQTQPRLA